MEMLQNIDRNLFHFLNGFHSSFFDHVMYYGSKGILWTPLYLILVFLVARKYRWQTLIVIITATLMITVSDQLANVSKELFQRLRPSYEPGLPVHLVNAYKGGMYGFYSAHASTTFAIAVFLIMLMERYHSFFFIPVILWACFMSYTRIYLGVHYPGDIIAGAIIGSLLGYSSAKFFFFSAAYLKRRFSKSDPG